LKDEERRLTPSQQGFSQISAVLSCNFGYQRNASFGELHIREHPVCFNELIKIFLREAKSGSFTLSRRNIRRELSQDPSNKVSAQSSQKDE
jgi:hypothetical protein